MLLKLEAGDVTKFFLKWRLRVFRVSDIPRLCEPPHMNFCIVEHDAKVKVWPTICLPLQG
jgi:hypothetical protein